jgi:hypothetical protein
LLYVDGRGRSCLTAVDCFGYIAITFDGASFGDEAATRLLGLDTPRASYLRDTIKGLPGRGAFYFLERAHEFA